MSRNFTTGHVKRLIIVYCGKVLITVEERTSGIKAIAEATRQYYDLGFGHRGTKPNIAASWGRKTITRLRCLKQTGYRRNTPTTNPPLVRLKLTQTSFYSLL